jgi:hypothetical protein
MAAKLEDLVQCQKFHFSANQLLRGGHFVKETPHESLGFGFLGRTAHIDQYRVLRNSIRK